MNQGDVFWYTFKEPDKRRPVLILTRNSAIPVLSSVTIAPITSVIRSIPTEVRLDRADVTDHRVRILHLRYPREVRALSFEKTTHGIYEHVES
ncbi:MAG: type II toxin-antitoxin system PemK/MazF family toxin [Syntrophobacteraceae bacterium]